MRMRRLHREDRDLLIEAWRWDEHRPRWYTEMDHIYNEGDVEDFIALVDNPCNWLVGVWESGLEAVIIVNLVEVGMFEAHLCAKRRANVAAITEAAHVLINQLREFQLTEAYVWIAKRHISVQRLCSIIGFQPDGAVRVKGTYRGRPIEWRRYSIKRKLEMVA